MPLYEYKCKSCGQVFEVIQKFSDERLTLHEACGGDLERLVSPPAFQFKGTGWYVTDYARAKGTGQARKGKNGGGDSSNSESTPAKTESKSETKSDSKPASTSK